MYTIRCLFFSRSHRVFDVGVFLMLGSPCAFGDFSSHFSLDLKIFARSEHRVRMKNAYIKDAWSIANAFSAPHNDAIAKHTHKHIQMHLDHWKLRPWNEGKAKLWDERERGKKQQQQCAALAAEKASTKFWHCQRTQMLREFICDIDKHSQWEPLLNARIHNRSERERAMGAQKIHTANTVSETNTKILCRYLLQSWRNTQTHSHSHTHTHTDHTLFRYGFRCFAALVVLCLFSVCAVYILGANYHRIQFLEHFHWDTKTHTNDDVSNMNHAHTP